MLSSISHPIIKNTEKKIPNSLRFQSYLLQEYAAIVCLSASTDQPLPDTQRDDSFRRRCKNSGFFALVLADGVGGGEGVEIISAPLRFGSCER
jgi:hypothetical protein